MYEILKRRYSKLELDKEKPDLLIVDGGKGQLNVALAVLDELGLRDLSAIGLAKDKGPIPKKIAEKTADKIYLPNVKDPILLGHSASLHYLQRIRDEAHRFAITYHKKLRGRRGLQTILDEIPGNRRGKEESPAAGIREPAEDSGGLRGPAQASGAPDPEGRADGL